MASIHLVLTDDWELFGDGSGNMRRIQFDTMKQLADIYDRFGLRGTFNVEVMQQLYHLDYGQRHPDLLALAREWESLVKDIYARGHDVQLHVHPQWHQAHYEDGQWLLNPRWSILDYSYEDAFHMLETSKAYLEALLAPDYPDYQCVAFRSGSWFLAPGDHILPILSKLGIRCDMSITKGLYTQLDHGQLDYRDIDEPFLPFYPQMHDARRLADREQPIVCVPTHSMRWGIGGGMLKCGAESGKAVAPCGATRLLASLSPAAQCDRSGRWRRGRGLLPAHVGAKYRPGEPAEQSDRVFEVPSGPGFGSLHVELS